MRRVSRNAPPTRHAAVVPLRHAAAAVKIMEQEEDVAEMPFEEGAHDALDADLRHRMISEAAYHLYAERGYSDGYDLDDWLQAEAQVHHMAIRGVEATAEEPPPESRDATAENA
jgi:hypothetical protein